MWQVIIGGWIKLDNSRSVYNNKQEKYDIIIVFNEYIKGSNRARGRTLQIQINLYTSIAMEKTFKHSKRQPRPYLHRHRKIRIIENKVQETLPAVPLLIT